MGPDTYAAFSFLSSKELLLKEQISHKAPFVGPSCSTTVPLAQSMASAVVEHSSSFQIAWFLSFAGWREAST